MNIRGIYGEGTQSQGDIYQISNNQSLGLTEKEIIKNVKIISRQNNRARKTSKKIFNKKAS